MVATVFYIYSALVFFLSAGLFLINRAKLREIPLYGALKQIPKWFYLLLAPILAFLCFLGICATSMVYSSLILTMLVAPFIFWHLSCEPMIVRKIAGDAMWENKSFARIISYGVRSRIYLIGVILHLCMMYVSFLNMY